MFATLELLLDLGQMLIIDTDLVLIDSAAQRIDTSCLGSHSSSPKSSITGIKVLLCELYRLLSKKKYCD